MTTSQKAVLKGSAPPLRRRDPSIVHPPLSFVQQRLWFIQQLEPESVAYNIPLTLRLTGPLNIAALEQSFNEIMRRHEILRTTFKTIESQPVQFISPPGHVNLDVVDLSEFDEVTKSSEVARYRKHELQSCFDVVQGPLWRTKLLRLDAQEHLVLFTMHHAISDGWSMIVLTQEMAQLYQAFLAGRPSPLPELPVQYGDYAVWQREWLRGDVLAAQVGYWRRQLAGAPPRIELPADRPHTPNRTTNGALHEFTFAPEVATKLEEVARRERATPFMVLLASLAALLSRFSGQDDVLVGTMIGGRPRIELEPLIGFFVNTLVVRIDLSGNPSFRELLTRVREATLGAYAHQDLPFEKIVEELQPERHLSLTPLCNVFLMMHNMPRPRVTVEGLRLELIPLDTAPAKFDLELVAGQTTQGMAGTFVYSTDLFDGPTIARMASRFQDFLCAAANSPEREISGLATTSSNESQELVGAFNADLE
jgi:condensation domain-containing protein